MISPKKLLHYSIAVSRNRTRQAAIFLLDEGAKLATKLSSKQLSLKEDIEEIPEVPVPNLFAAEEDLPLRNLEPIVRPVEDED